MKGRRVAGACPALFLLLLMAVPLQGRSETSAPRTETARTGRGETGNGRVSRATDKGLFHVSVAIDGKELAVGANQVTLVIRDRQNGEVTGAEVAVTPWMPEHGHGVWEKPVVTEQGGGRYRVGNVVLVMGGLWELRVTVRSGTGEDRAAFSFPVGESGGKPGEGLDKPEGKYLRTVEYYKVPNVTLLNQDGKRIGLRSLLDSGKPVIVDFIYTTCTTICPLLSAVFAGVREELGDAAGGVQLVSISLDPEYDRPEVMKDYLARFDAGEEWDFLTGSREDITLVLKAFNAYVPDKMSHSPLYLVRGPKAAEWVRINGLIGTSELMREFRSLEHR